MVKITKALAQKMYNEGKEVMVVPCKVTAKHPLAQWVTKPENDENATFQRLCDITFHYNCNDKTGMTLAYYAKEV